MLAIGYCLAKAEECEETAAATPLAWAAEEWRRMAQEWRQTAEETAFDAVGQFGLDLMQRQDFV